MYLHLNSKTQLNIFFVLYMLSGDYLYNIIEYDPDYNHRLISKEFKNICDRLSTYFKVWNIDFDNDQQALKYIDNNILFLQKWGADYDIDWYKKIMFTSPVILNQSPGTIQLDLEIDMAGTSLDRFIFYYEHFLPVINHFNLQFLIGVYNNIEALEYLIEKDNAINYNLISGAIRAGNPQILLKLQEYIVDVDGMFLNLENTIESHSNVEIRNILNNLGIKDAPIPPVIYPEHYNIQNIHYVNGLIALNKTAENLNFNNINRNIFLMNNKLFNNEYVYNEYVYNVIEKLINNKLHNDMFLTAIKCSCLEFGFILLLNKLWDNMPNNITRFVLKHRLYLNLSTMKWIDCWYYLEQDDYKKIYNDPVVRDLKTAIYCLKNIHHANP